MRKMKRIKNTEQLRSEQLRLLRERTRLEGDIREDWRGLRRAFDPAEYGREALVSGLSWLGRRIFPKKERPATFGRFGRTFSKKTK